MGRCSSSKPLVTFHAADCIAHFGTYRITLAHRIRTATMLVIMLLLSQYLPPYGLHHNRCSSRASQTDLLFGMGPRPPLIVVMWSAETSFGYESFITGARELSKAGMNSLRVSNLYQARSIGKELEKWGPDGISYAVYELGDGDMRLLGRYPKSVNADGAKIKFRRRTPRTGGAADSELGVGGMGDDIWRELLEREQWSSLDEAWKAFRSQLELGHEIEVVDERGDSIFPESDYEDDINPTYD